MSLKTLNLVKNWHIYDDISKYTKLRAEFSKILVKFLITRSNLDRFLRFWAHLEGILKEYRLANRLRQEPVAIGSATAVFRSET